MSLDENIDDELDLDELFDDVIVPDENMYISNEDKAVELLSDLIKNKSDNSRYYKKKVEDKINQLFSLFAEVTIEDKMILYEKLMGLCSRLSLRQKQRKLNNKVVVSFGGKVSAGKSKFINTISGIGDKLPVDQKTTTAIPTYIMGSAVDKIHANSVYGYSTEISTEALHAMAHEFDAVYGIGFPSFVESIIIESKEYALPEDVVLLDTPGYTKYDEGQTAKRFLSDREKAFEQLSVSDYLIWLIDIDNGTITDDDIQFIESLRIKTPILIIFTKADLKSESEISQIIKTASDTVNGTSINCFGITAYSANLKREFGNDEIKKFLNYSLSGNIRGNDLKGEFRNIEKDMRKSINKRIDESGNTARALFSYIAQSSKITEIRSLAKLWGKANQDRYVLNGLLKKYDIIIQEIYREIDKFVT